MIGELRDAIPINAVPCLLPLKQGKQVHVSTIWRWAQRGCRGHKLRLVKCGGTFVLRSELERFLIAINDRTPNHAVAHGAPSAPPRRKAAAGEAKPSGPRTEDWGEPRAPTRREPKARQRTVGAATQGR